MWTVQQTLNKGNLTLNLETLAIINDMDNSSFNCLRYEELSIHILIAVPSLTIEGLRSTFSTQAGAGKISGILTNHLLVHLAKSSHYKVMVQIHG